MNSLSRTLTLLALAAVPFLSSAQTAPAPAAAPAAAAKAPPAPTLEQRVAGLEAYVGNTDPTAPLKVAKDKDGNATIPEGLTTASVGVAGPGHNAFMMICASLLLFMTLVALGPLVKVFKRSSADEAFGLAEFPG